MFLKIRKNLAILLLSSFLIFGAIPHVVVAYESDIDWEVKATLDWEVKATYYFHTIQTDVRNLNEVVHTDNWKTSIEYLKYTDRMYTDSQEAINWSESYKTTKCMTRIRPSGSICVMY